MKHKTGWGVVGLVLGLALHNQAQAAPSLAMPKAFQGRWAAAVDVANAHKVCRGQYRGDDAVVLKINAAQNRIDAHYYENDATMKWGSISSHSATEVKGQLHTTTQFEGDDEMTHFQAPAQMVLQAQGKQMLTRNVVQRNTNRVLVWCDNKL